MDLIKLLKTKIYNRVTFLSFAFSIIFLILLLLLVINTFAQNRDISNFQNVLLTFKQIFQKNSQYWAPEPILIIIFTLLLFMFYVILDMLLKFIWRFINSPDIWELNKNFNLECFNDLEIQGIVSKDRKDLKFTSSAAGCLLKGIYWKNFKIEFDFNFNGLKLDKNPEEDWVKIADDYELKKHKPLNNFFGLLFRAQDLNNYFMLSIGIKQKLKGISRTKKIGKRNYDLKVLITPHIKVSGDWEVSESTEFKLRDMRVNKDNHVICKVEGNISTLNIGEAVKDYRWILPDKVRVNWITSDPKIDQTGIHQIGDPTSIPFRNSYGMIGFRAYGEERVTIKNIIITRL